MDRSVEDYQKDLLWQTSLETFYRIAYAESLMSSVLQKWRPIDAAIKGVVTLATVASVMVGWMSWGTPIGKVPWLIIAGSAALLAFLHVILKVSDRIADLSHTAQYFKSLRLNLERFIYEMEVNPDFSLEPFRVTFEQYREWYLVGSQMLKEDFALTRRHRQKVQDKLNQQMGDMIL